MLGTIVNAAAIVAGSAVGLLLKKGIPPRMTDAIMRGVGLCILYIGISGSLQGTNALIAILAMVLGAITGTLLNLDDKLKALGDLAQRHMRAGEEGGISAAFVTASLLFCVGSMSVVGSLQSGLVGDHTMLFTKSMLDGISAIVLTASMGVGIMLSAAAVLVFQGAIALLSQLLAPVLSPTVVAEMSCVGSILIIALGLNMLEVTKIKVMNYMPAIFFAIGLCYLF
ncbi:MAG: DUF554 domain-containing protein [Christensenellaceae bacterium]|nr:DUF554 domain-containing protein [Christensenellaceae bacterium]